MESASATPSHTTLVHAEIPAHGAFLLGKALELVNAADPSARTVDLLFDETAGLFLVSPMVQLELERAAFSRWEFSEESALDDEFLDDLDLPETGGEAVFALRVRELRRISRQFRALTPKDSLRLEVRQSAGSKAPDLLYVLVGSNREYCNAVSVVDAPASYLESRQPEDTTLVTSAAPPKVVEVYNAFRDTKMRGVSFAPGRNPFSGRTAVACEVVQTGISTTPGDRIFLDTEEPEVTMPAAVSVPIKALAMFKTVGAMTSSVELAVNDSGARSLVALARVPKGLKPPRPPVDDCAPPPSKRPAPSSQLAAVGSLTLRLPAL